jgi:hypothetical protein
MRRSRKMPPYRLSTLEQSYTVTGVRIAMSIFISLCSTAYVLTVVIWGGLDTVTNTFRTAMTKWGVRDRFAKRPRFGGGDDQVHSDIPDDLQDLCHRFWGKPLDALPDTVDFETEDEEKPSDLLPGEGFLLDIDPQLLVRAEYIRLK